MIAPAVARILADAILDGDARRGADRSRPGAFRGESPRARAPAGLERAMFLQLLANGLVTGSVIAIAAVGVSIVYGILRLVNFAYGDLMAFGALAAYAFNGPLGIPLLVVGAARDGRDRGALARCSTLVLWRPLRTAARRLHEPLPRLDRARARAPPGAPARVRAAAADLPRRPVQGLRDRQRAPVAGAARSRSSTAAVAIVALGLFLARTTLGRTMRALADDRALAAIAGIDVGRIDRADVDPLRPPRRGSRACWPGSSRRAFDPNFGFQLLLPIFAAVVLGGIGSAYGALAGGLAARDRDGALDVAVVPRRRRPRLQAGRRVRRARRRADGAAAGALRPGEGRVSALASGDFWAFVGVVAGIYTILALGLQLAVRLHRAPQLRPGRVHGDRRVHDGDPRREGGLEHVARGAARGASRRPSAGVLLGLPSLRLRADYFAIVTIAFSEIVRYVATNEQSLTGGSQGTIALGKVGEAAQYNGQWERFQALGAGRGSARLERRRDARDRLGRRRRAARARLARGAHAVGPRAARDPRGRGRRRVARQERVRLQAPGARARLGARRRRRGASTRGSSRSSAPTTSSRC